MLSFSSYMQKGQPTKHSHVKTLPYIHRMATAVSLLLKLGQSIVGNVSAVCTVWVLFAM